MQALTTILIVVIAAGALLWLGTWSRRDDRGYLATQLRYQPLSLIVALVALLAGWLLVPSGPKVLAVGDMSAPTSGLGWLGVGEGDSWASVGLTFLVIMTIVTAIVVWFQVGRGCTAAAILKALPVAVALSIVNAFVEEAIFRVVLAHGLANFWSATAIAITSAIVFGLPHWFGTPARVAGVLLAGFMGWFLMLSVLQTGGIGWAWSIHVVQDVVIIALLIARDRPARLQVQSLA